MKELPLFPLTGVVLFPGSVLPLHIFEHRYRRMIKDVTKRDSRFGVINVTDGCGLADVGCIAQILKLETLPDGRSNVIAVGVDRFSLVRETLADDYPRAVVKEFREISKPKVTHTHLNKASSTLLEVLKLIARLNKRSPDADIEIPKDPKNLSFLIASSLPSLPFIKQDLLEMQDTDLRLAREIPILEDFRDHLRAVLAIEDAFENSPESLL